MGRISAPMLHNTQLKTKVAPARMHGIVSFARTLVQCLMAAAGLCLRDSRLEHGKFVATRAESARAAELIHHGYREVANEQHRGCNHLNDDERHDESPLLFRRAVYVLAVTA